MDGYSTDRGDRPVWSGSGAVIRGIPLQLLQPAGIHRGLYGLPDCGLVGRALARSAARLVR